MLAFLYRLAILQFDMLQMSSAYTIYMSLQPVVVALSGNVLEYMLSLAYVVGGALLGTPAGGEFLAAKDAATQVRFLTQLLKHW